MNGLPSSFWFQELPQSAKNAMGIPLLLLDKSYRNVAFSSQMNQLRFGNGKPIKK